VVAHLLELGQDGQDGAGIVHAPARAQRVDGRLRLGLNLVIQGTLLHGQLAPLVHLDLLRQIARHLLLQPAQHERPDTPPQPLDRRLVAAKDRVLEHPLERAIGSQVAGHQEVIDRPQLRRPVLHRRATKGQAMSSIERLNRLGPCRSRVLDGRRLVKNNVEERDGCQWLDGTAHRIVGGHGDHRLGRV